AGRRHRCPGRRATRSDTWTAGRNPSPTPPARQPRRSWVRLPRGLSCFQYPTPLTRRACAEGGREAFVLLGRVVRLRRQPEEHPVVPRGQGDLDPVLLEEPPLERLALRSGGHDARPQLRDAHRADPIIR